MGGGKEACMVEEVKQFLADGKRVVICVSSEEERQRIVSTYGLPENNVMVSGDGVSANMSTLPATLEYFDRRGM